jgi:hypothetical protein
MQRGYKAPFLFHVEHHKPKCSTLVLHVAPKLYHIILARVKLFLITYFLCVFKKQHGFMLYSAHGQKITSKNTRPQLCDGLGFAL